MNFKFDRKIKKKKQIFSQFAAGFAGGRGYGRRAEASRQLLPGASQKLGNCHNSKIGVF